MTDHREREKTHITRKEREKERKGERAAPAMVDSDDIIVVWFDAEASPPPPLPVVRSAPVLSHCRTQAAPSVAVVLAAVSLRTHTASALATNSVGS